MKFFKNLKYIEATDFFEICGDVYKRRNMRNDISEGTVFIVKKIVSIPEIDSFISDVINLDLKENSNFQILEGCENIKYKSNTDGDGQNQYSANDTSWYFFPWNKDECGAIKIFQKIFNLVIKINGYDPNEILKNTPSNNIIQRFHLIHYPLGYGKISPHIDPINIVDVNSGIYFTEFGSDYNCGGFYVFDEKNEKFFLDKYIKKGDLVLFSPNLVHGVDIVDKKNSVIDKNTEKMSGRLFFNMTLIESHEVALRQKTVAVKNV